VSLAWAKAKPMMVVVITETSIFFKENSYRLIYGNYLIVN
jgi:hypothetical protein